jgi:hypothetical protein
MSVKVIASLRGRKDKPARAVICACANPKCHPATIKKGQEGDGSRCASCRHLLKPIMEIATTSNERVTVSAQNISEGASFIFITHCLISTRDKKREKFFLHKGVLQRAR